MAIKAHVHYLTARARALRQRSTEPEMLLCQRVRNRKCCNLKFKRQVPIGRYITDFYCAELELVIELEGGIHEHPDQKKYDNLRTRELQARGLRVWRIPNEEVLVDIDAVLRKIGELKESLRRGEMRQDGRQSTSPCGRLLKSGERRVPRPAPH